MTIACAEGYKITAISFTTDSSNMATTSNCTVTNATAEGLGTTSVVLTPTEGATNVVLTNPASSGHIRFQTMTVTYEKI